MGESLGLVAKREDEGTGWKSREESPAGEPQEGSLRASQLQRVPCRVPHS